MFSSIGTTGRILHRNSVRDIVLSEVEYRAGSAETLHAHPAAYLVVTVEGSVLTHASGTTSQSPANSARLIPANQLHRNEYRSSRTRTWSLALEEHHHRAAWRCLPSDVMHFPQSHTVTDMLLRVRQEHVRQERGWEVAVEGLTLQICAGIARMPVCRDVLPRWLWQGKEMLSQRFREPIDVRGVARELNVHPTYFSQRFKIAYGCTPTNFVLRLRVEHARTMLSSTHLPLSLIALEAGFTDQSQMTALFRRLLGATPGSLRRGPRGLDLGRDRIS